jgi:hypothetical protein
MVTLVGQDDFVGITVGSNSKVTEITGNQTKCVLVSYEHFRLPGKYIYGIECIT